MPAASRSGRPSSASPGPASPSGFVGSRREAGEVALFLEFSRALTEVDALGGLTAALGDVLAGIVPWAALAVVPGTSTPVEVRTGAAGTDVAGLRAFEKAVETAARDAGLAPITMRWEQPPAAGVARRQVEPLVLPVARRGGRKGLIALLPDGDASPSPRVRRLLAGLAQQVGPVLDRLERTGTLESARLVALLDTLPAGVLITDEAGHLRRANPAGARILASLAGGEVAPGAALPALGLTLDSGPTRPAVEFSSCADQRTYLLRTSVLRGDGGEVERVLVLDDVSVERAQRDQSRQTEKLSALGEMLSGVAHELNNPLSTVIGYAQLLSRQPHDDDTRRRLEMVAGEAERCRRIVQSLLDVARARAPENVPININDLVQGAVDLFAYRMRVDDIQVVWEPRSHLPTIAGDRHRLQQVLVNLIGNAHHALREHDGERRLTLTASAQSGRVSVEVADSGPGIPAAHLDRIFEPFFTTKDPGVGTGLGLSLALRTLREHGGNLIARSDPGIGAMFVLDLPARIEAVAAMGHGAGAGAIIAARDLLVVEDEDGFRQLLAEALGEVGHRVRTAIDGRAALAMLEEHPADLVVSDMRMPNLDGRGLWNEVARRRPELADRFVFMTGDAISIDTRRFLDAHGLVCMHKPFGLDELERVIRDVLSGSREARGAVVDSPPRGPDEAAPRAR